MVLITTSKNTKAKSLKEFVDYAKANPGKLSYATFGPQSIANLAANRFKEQVGIDWREVPYKGAPQIVQDMLNGTVDAYWGLTTSWLPAQRPAGHRAARPCRQEAQRAPAGCADIRRAGCVAVCRVQRHRPAGRCRHAEADCRQAAQGARRRPGRWTT